MNSPPHIAILILAAGASRRMGHPKQLLPWGKTTLLGHTIAKALQSVATEVILILGAHKSSIEKEIEHHQIEVLENAQWETGLGSSIACGVAHLLKTHKKVDGVLVMLADQPQIDHHYLNLLIKAFQQRPKYIIATSYGKRGGVPAIFGKSYFEALLDLQEDHGAKHLMKMHSNTLMLICPEKPIVDIDTIEDYWKHLQQLS